MIVTSPETKAAFNPGDGRGGRYVTYQVALEIMNNEAQDSVTVTAAQDASISRPEQAYNRSGEVLDVISFEGFGWRLDGSQYVPPRVDEVPSAEMGLWMAEISDAEGYFSTPQLITATTPAPYSYVATSFNWGHTIATDYSVRWLGAGDVLIAEQDVVGNTQRQVVVNQATEGVVKIEIRVTRTLLPNRRVRLAEITMGAIKIYDKTNSTSLRIDETLDPFNATAPANTLRLVADNFSREFNVLDPVGIYEFFRGKRVITASIGAQREDGSIEYIPMGTYYTRAPAMRGNLTTMELEAVNLLGQLQATTYTHGTYRTGTLASFIDELATDAGIFVEYPARFTSITLSGYLPSRTHADLFRMLSAAGSTLMRVSRDNRLVFFDPVLASELTFGSEDYRMGDGIDPSDDTIFNAVDIAVATPTAEATATELARAGTTGTSITTREFYADNAVITTNAGVLNIQHSPAVDVTATLDSGQVVLMGRKINLNERTLRLTEQLLPNEEVYAHPVAANIFVQAVNADAVATRMLELRATQRRKVQASYRGYPFVELGDVVDYVLPDGLTPTQAFFITSNSLNLSGGGMTGTLSSRER